MARVFEFDGDRTVPHKFGKSRDKIDIDVFRSDLLYLRNGVTISLRQVH